MVDTRVDDLRFKADRRSAQTVVMEMLFFVLAASVIGVSFAVFIGNVFNSELDRGRGSAAANIGQSALENLGWGFGVMASVVLGCLAAAVGGSLVLEDQGEALAFRRLLGLLAELSTASLAPGMLFAIIGCVSNPADFGSLMVITPSFLVLCVLAAQVGRFAVPDPVRQLRRAREDLGWSRQVLRVLARTRKGSRVAVTVGGGVLVAVPGVAILLFGGRAERLGLLVTCCLTLFLVGFCVALLTVSVEWAASVKVARKSLDRFAAWIFLVYFGATFVSAVILMVALDTVVGVAFCVSFALGAVIWVWSLRAVLDQSRWGGGGPVGAASNTAARKTLGRMFVSSRNVIDRIESRAVVEEGVASEGWKSRILYSAEVLLGVHAPTQKPRQERGPKG